MILRSASPLLLLGALAGCTVGPAYDGPPAASSGGLPAQFAHADPASATAPVSDRWWSAFNDPILDDLEARALAGSPDIAVAEARLRGARAMLRLERANGAPRVNALVSAAQAYLPNSNINQGGNGGGDDEFDYYTAGFDASWEIDLFGGQRRKVEGARASLAAIESDAADARVSLTAEVAMAYAELRDHQRRIALAREDSAINHQSLALAEQRFARGAASELDVARMRTIAETADADLAPLIAEAESRMNALAILTGAAPGALDALLSPSAPGLLPPASIAVADPAALLQRRPDIRAAERRLAAENARIGVAEAARFPRIQLFGVIGLGGSDPSDIGDFDEIALLAAPTLQWNILDFGRSAARVKQAEARRDEAEAVWRRTVLAALRDAQDALTRFGQRRSTVASLGRASVAADRAALLMRQRFEAGTVTKFELHEAERQRISSQQRLTIATAALSMDFIALQKALGLGWANPTA